MAAIEQDSPAEIPGVPVPPEFEPSEKTIEIPMPLAESLGFMKSAILGGLEELELLIRFYRRMNDVETVNRITEATYPFHSILEGIKGTAQENYVEQQNYIAAVNEWRQSYGNFRVGFAENSAPEAAKEDDEESHEED